MCSCGLSLCLCGVVQEKECGKYFADCGCPRCLAEDDRVAEAVMRRIEREEHKEKTNAAKAAKAKEN